jgi:hypothetical protein
MGRAASGVSRGGLSTRESGSSARMVWLFWIPPRSSMMKGPSSRPAYTPQALATTISAHVTDASRSLREGVFMGWQGVQARFRAVDGTQLRRDSSNKRFEALSVDTE